MFHRLTKKDPGLYKEPDLIIREPGCSAAGVKQKLLPELLDNPKALVGRKISHKCREEDGTVGWFSAGVVDVCTIKANVINTEYAFVYMTFLMTLGHFPF